MRVIQESRTNKFVSRLGGSTGQQRNPNFPADMTVGIPTSRGVPFHLSAMPSCGESLGYSSLNQGVRAPRGRHVAAESELSGRGERAVQQEGLAEGRVRA